MQPDQIPPDGKIHRFKGSSRSGLSGWAVSYGEFGAYGDWATGETETFFNGHRPSKRTRKMILKKLEDDKEKSQRQAAKECFEIWNTADECYHHPYLEKKKVDSFELRVKNDLLIVPLHDSEGQIWSLQYIYPNGQKRFYSGGKKKGLFYLMGDFSDPLFVCEGYATGASIRMAAKVCVAVAFDAGNLYEVVRTLKNLDRSRNIYIAADNDKWKPEAGNAGYWHATECARELGCGVVFPQFKEESSHPTDFNDLHCLEGLGVVQDQIMGILNLSVS